MVRRRLRAFLRRRGSARSLRTTFAVSFAAVAAVVTVLVGLLSYDAAARLVRVDQQAVFNEVVHDLKVQVKHEKLTPYDFVVGDPDHDGPRDDLIRPARTNVQILGSGGVIVDAGSPRLPVNAADKLTADYAKPGLTSDGKGVSGPGSRRDVQLGGDEYRMTTVSLGGGRGAVQVAQQFSDTEDLLRQLQRRTGVVALAVILASAFVGWWLARRITRRLVLLAGAAEEVAGTGHLDVRVPVEGGDEVGSLGRSFDRMLGRLARAIEDQRRLVQDAGHELRTPLTSLRTNISLLRRIEDLPPAAREELIADLAQESRELTDLVNELVDLAAGKEDDEPVVEVELADTAEDVAVLTRRRTGREITVRVTGATAIQGRPASLQRALSNLVENAAKFDRGGTEPIQIVVTGGIPDGVRVEVLDRGPGIADSDLERVFDRFYRAPAARSLPGSGLGLSIVQEVASAHGGRAFAERRTGGGAAIGFTVRGVRTEEEA
ncbi:HAMP domain-containing sensor histidine kinase [Streptomyces sp. NPDC046821]|uniref:HAMP domain-containing sensor histidine kinase n=1 Tax=Streptomyces sp. NPDC046821 TaxID=3154702 RepID=UPI0033F70627